MLRGGHPGTEQEHCNCTSDRKFASDAPDYDPRAKFPLSAAPVQVQDENFCARIPPSLTASTATPFLVTSYRITYLAVKLPYPGQACKSAWEISLFAQKFLVAFDNSQGMVYAPVSGWDQAYLLWTFRNFRSLPQNVLNPRQQQLMASLYRNASEHSLRGLSDAFVVGRIEDFDPAKLLAIPTSRKDRTPASSPPQEKLADVAVLDRDQRSHAPFTLGRLTLKIGAGALVAVIAILAWHQLGAQPVSHSAVTDSQPTHVAIAVQSHKAAASPADRVGKSHRTITAPPVVDQASADQPLMRISGRPRKLIYPVCPETGSRGKVSLQAVVENDGKVSRVRVLTGDRILAKAAVEAVRQWRYEPSPDPAIHVERETNITVSFISNEVVAVSFPESAPLSR